MRRGLGAALLAALIAAPAAAQEGVYRLDMRETASALLIREGGRFEWYFSQGSLDLVAAGAWRREGERLVLTSDPGIRPPRFTLAGRSSGAGPGVLVRVTTAKGEAVEGVDVLVGGASGYTSGGEYRADVAQAAEVRLAIGAAGVRPQAFPLAVRAGDELSFTFEPNDLGVEDFRQVTAAITSTGLALRWAGQELAYERAAEAAEE